MRIGLTEDEEYPVYTVADESDRYCPVWDVPDDVGARWKAAQAEWDKCQDEMMELFRHGKLPQPIVSPADSHHKRGR